MLPNWPNLIDPLHHRANSDASSSPLPHHDSLMPNRHQPVSTYPILAAFMSVSQVRSLHVHVCHTSCQD